MDDDEPESPHAAGREVAPPVVASGAPPSIDIALLTSKVLRLMQDELRLEKARGAGAWRKRG